MTKRNASLNARRRQFFADEAIAIRRRRAWQRVRKASGYTAFSSREAQARTSVQKNKASIHHPIWEEFPGAPEESSRTAMQGGDASRTVPALIRFPHGMFTGLRRAMLADLSRSQSGLLAARRETAPDGREVFVVQEAFLAQPEELIAKGPFRVRPAEAFVKRVMARLQADMQVNAVIGVHTHPWSAAAFFSSSDDGDERRFSAWLERSGAGMGYASLLLSAEAWQARVWRGGQEMPALVKTQTLPEAVPQEFPLDFPRNCPQRPEAATPEMQSRTALALGVDVIRRIASDQLVVLAGVGGLGSVMAEQLVRSGFTHVGLVDPDVLELTNLNRFAGGYRDSVGRLKVDVVREHLLRINPEARIEALACGAEDPQAQSLMAGADWIAVSTDSHSSRRCVQQTALRYGVPLLSAGVSITVAREGGRHRIVDQSGEVIVARHGDGFCLHCLGRINPYKAAAEENPDEAVRTGLVTRGYVQGMQEKEPAVMPLNAAIASIACQTLLDQYRADAVHQPVVVYESHGGSRCWPDTESLDALPDTCPACGRNVRRGAAGGWLLGDLAFLPSRS